MFNKRGSRPQRVTLTVVLAMLAGAGIAWMVAGYAVVQGSDLDRRAVGTNMPSVPYLPERHGAFKAYVEDGAGRTEVAAQGLDDGRVWHESWYLGAGWPLRAFCIARERRVLLTGTMSMPTSLAEAPSNSLSWGLRAPRWTVNRRWTLEPRFLPLLPIIPGLLIDSALYGGVLFGAAWLVHTGLRRLRLRPSTCGTCGYDHRGLPADAVCPECGRSTQGTVPAV